MGAGTDQLSAPTRTIDGLSAIIDTFDAVLLDQWGVLHDGARAYPLAIETLQRLKRAGKTIIVLSNSGKSGEDNAKRIVSMGFDGAAIDAVVSAGDDARDAILHPDEDFHRALGSRCLLFARPADAALGDGLGVSVTLAGNDPLAAGVVDSVDFLLVMSMDAPAQSVARWAPLLERAALRELPMVCGNPDLARVSPGGTLYEAPGLVAKRYAELGGQVRWHGKPHARIYRHCLRLIEARLAECLPGALPRALPGLARGRVLAIGDSLHHDVLGAREAGLASLLIAGGVHRDAICDPHCGAIDPHAAARLFEREQICPDWLAPSFRW